MIDEVGTKIPAIHERTVVLIKPDGVQRSKIGEIVTRFEEKGFKLIAMKFVNIDKETARLHNANKRNNSSLYKFSSDYLDPFKMGPVIKMIWEGQDIINSTLRMIGAINDNEDSIYSMPGSMKGDFSVETEFER